MNVAEAGQPRHFLVEPRIVLHRARAERIGVRIDRRVHARQAHVVANRFRLGEAGKAASAGAFKRPEARLCRRRRVDVDAGHLGAADLENQWLFEIESAIAGERLACPRRMLGRFGVPRLRVQHQ
jgi:hypothetical protein